MGNTTVRLHCSACGVTKSVRLITFGGGFVGICPTCNGLLYNGNAPPGKGVKPIFSTPVLKQSLTKGPRPCLRL